MDKLEFTFENQSYVFYYDKNDKMVLDHFYSWCKDKFGPVSGPVTYDDYFEQLVA